MDIDIDKAIAVGAWSFIGVILLVCVAGLLMGMRTRRQRQAAEAEIAKKDARRWYEMLGDQLKYLKVGDDEVAAEAVATAADHHAVAAAALGKAKKIDDFRRVRYNAAEGLRYIGAVRARLGMTPGPQGPPPVAPDGRPMYEEGYRAAPMGHNAQYEARGSAASLNTRGADSVSR